MTTHTETEDSPTGLADYLSRHMSSPETISLSHRNRRDGLLSITTGRNTIGLNGQTRPAEILIDTSQINPRFALLALQRVRRGQYKTKNIYSGGAEAAIAQAHILPDTQGKLQNIAIKIARPKTTTRLCTDKPCTSQIDAMKAAIAMRKQTRDRAILIPAAATDRVAISYWKPWTYSITQITNGVHKMPLPKTIKDQLDYFFSDVCISSMLPRLTTTRRLRKWVNTHLDTGNDVFEFDMLRPNNIGLHIFKLLSLFREWRSHPEYHHVHRAREIVFGENGINQALFKGLTPDITPLQRYCRTMNKHQKRFTTMLNEISTIFEVMFVSTKNELVA